MYKDYITPLNIEALFEGHSFKPNQIGNTIHVWQNEKLDLSQFQLAIIGVHEERGSAENKGTASGSIHFRQEFYKLFVPFSNIPFQVIDLGNIKPGATHKDTYFGLASVLLEMHTHKVIPIIIGGGHDLTFGQYLSYQELYKLVNLVVIDERLDMDDPADTMDSNSYLMPILAHNPNYLFNYSHIGYQTYLNDKHAIEMLESLNFECHRLGMVRQKLEEMEPVLRDADMLSIDMNCIRMADSPGHALASPNGFSGEELCQLTRYAGLSDKLTSIGFYEFNPDFDEKNQSAQLLAQMVWYFIEGFYSRKGDYPIQIESFLRFTVAIEDFEYELVFWKSKATNRWWMELPFVDKKYEKHQMIPCSFLDYELACKGELPDRWMRVYNKLLEG